MDHRRWLDELVVQYLNENSAHTFRVIGMTSRSGPEASNQTLSEKRASEVFAFLKNKNVAGQAETRLGSAISGMGEGAASTAGERDNSENPYFRAVDVWMFKNLTEYQQFNFGRPISETQGIV